MPEITGVLLAAGQSKRFGGNKLLTEIDKRAMVLHAAASLSACDRLLAVVRREDLAIQQLLQVASIKLVINDAADQGMGSSIACGVAASQQSHGWCLLPADMPFVKPATTLEVISALKQGATLAAPFYQNRRGHPVGFGHELTSELLALDNEPGARRIVSQYQQRLVMINSNDEGVLVDIDTPDDLKQALL
ncbi:MAG: nucleotidyltransferase family protein [Pseudomonadota bacterium]|nr:nucleotidyltransferase family protein [Pseudomonadota bacterium]